MIPQNIILKFKIFCLYVYMIIIEVFCKLVFEFYKFLFKASDAVLDIGNSIVKSLNRLEELRYFLKEGKQAPCGYCGIGHIGKCIDRGEDAFNHER